MVDALIRVIDRLTQLLEITKRFNRQIFEDHIGPIYKDLQVIIDDYREIILAIETKLNTGVTIEKLLDELVLRREKYARVRDEVKKYAHALADAKLNEDVYEFARSCLDLFQFEPTMPRGSYVQSAITSLMEDIDFVTTYPSEKRSLSRLINEYKLRLGYHWNDVSWKYFQLRAKYLK
jgi:hypothetical protein